MIHQPANPASSWIADEYAIIIAQLDQLLRLLGEMLDCHPRLRGDIMARLDGVLDERNRVTRIAEIVTADEADQAA